MALYSANSDYAEKLCIKLSRHEDVNVRGNVILRFGHIARVRESLNLDIIEPIVKDALSNENEFIPTQPVTAKDDLENYLYWKFEN